MRALPEREARYRPATAKLTSHLSMWAGQMVAGEGGAESGTKTRFTGGEGAVAAAVEPWGLGRIRTELPWLLAQVAEFHRLLDEWVEAWIASELPRLATAEEGTDIRCGAGCEACCRHMVRSVEPFEHLRMYAEIRERGELERLLEQAFAAEEAFRRCQADPRVLAVGASAVGAVDDEALDDEALQVYFELGRTCPVLGPEGKCSAYAARSASCRLFLSLSDPRFCAPPANRGPENCNLFLELPDEAEESIGRISEALGLLELGDRLSDGLLTMNRWEGELFG